MRLKAEQRERWVIMTAEPTDKTKVTLTETSAGTRAECYFTTNTRLSATASTTVTEASLCDTASAQTPDQRQWDGTIEIFVDYDETNDGELATGTDGAAVREALRSFGEKIWLLRLRGPVYTTPLTAGEPYDLYEGVPDAWQDPADRSGSFKEVYPFLVHNQYEGELAAGA